MHPYIQPAIELTDQVTPAWTVKRLTSLRHLDVEQFLKSAREILLEASG